jgi:hypothetical protein
VIITLIYGQSVERVIYFWRTAGSGYYATCEHDPRARQVFLWTNLNLLVRQNERILTEVGSLRDGMAVLTAMVTRLDGSHAALLRATLARARLRDLQLL